MSNERVHCGTTGWSFDDWVGPFYPPGTPAANYLAEYARHYDLVEVDTTFYRIPSVKMVAGWAAKTPSHFRFALKCPRSITHDAVLADCDDEMERFLEALAPLGSKLHGVVLQFGYFNRGAFASARPFFERLAKFLACFAGRVPLVCEIRNKHWLTPEYFDLLRAHRVVAALVEQAWLPPIDQVIERGDVLTGPFAYARLIGDRDGIEKVTQSWERTVIDRDDDLTRIAKSLRAIAERADLFVVVNNHYAGHAPTTIEQLRERLKLA